MTENKPIAGDVKMPDEIWAGKNEDGYVIVSEKVWDDYNTKCRVKYIHADTAAQEAEGWKKRCFELDERNSGLTMEHQKMYERVKELDRLKDYTWADTLPMPSAEELLARNRILRHENEQVYIATGKLEDEIVRLTAELAASRKDAEILAGVLVDLEKLGTRWQGQGVLGSQMFIIGTAVAAPCREALYRLQREKS